MYLSYKINNYPMERFYNVEKIDQKDGSIMLSVIEFDGNLMIHEETLEEAELELKRVFEEWIDAAIENNSEIPGIGRHDNISRDYVWLSEHNKITKRIFLNHTKYSGNVWKVEFLENTFILEGNDNSFKNEILNKYKENYCLTHPNENSILHVDVIDEYTTQYGDMYRNGCLETHDINVYKLQKRIRELETMIADMCMKLNK